MDADVGRVAVSPWPGFALYFVLGTLVVLSVISIGWLLLGPVLLVIGFSLRSPSVRPGISGLALGAGVAFLFLAATANGGSYSASFVRMGIPLVFLGLVDQMRRAWIAPKPN